MPAIDSSHKSHGAAFDRRFTTTHWSLVLAAGNYPTPEALAALGKLYRSYWYPLYCYVRHRGHEPVDAEDLTQAFFAYLLERNILGGLVRERGKFRSFLLNAITNFLNDDWDKQRALKRGGGVPLFSVDTRAGEERLMNEAVTTMSPERLFDRRWAATLVENTLTKLRDEYHGDGKARVFERLNGLMTGERETKTYKETGGELNMSEAAIKMAVLRLRSRFRELFRVEVAQTVAGQVEMEEELRSIRAIMSE